MRRLIKAVLSIALIYRKFLGGFLYDENKGYSRAYRKSHNLTKRLFKYVG